MGPMTYDQAEQIIDSLDYIILLLSALVMLFILKWLFGGNK